MPRAITCNTAWLAATKSAACKYTNVGHKQLTGLQPGTTYKYRIKTLCAGTGLSSVWTSWKTLKTLDHSCIPPTTLPTAPVGASLAKVRWQAAPGALGYEIRYKALLGSWDTLNAGANATHRWLSQLSSNWYYEWQIRKRCTYGTAQMSAWSPVQSFWTTAPAKHEGPQPAAPQAQELTIALLPNPAHESTQLLWKSVPANTPTAHLAIYDLTGRLLHQQSLHPKAGQRSTVQWGASIAPGSYIVAIQAGAVRLTRQLVIQ